MLTLEFKTFVNAFVLLPCQIVKTGRKVVYRLLGWNPHLADLLPADPPAALLSRPSPKSGSGCPDPPQRREPGSRKENHPEHARHENCPPASDTAWRRAAVKSAFHKMLTPIGRGLRLFKA